MNNNQSPASHEVRELKQGTKVKHKIHGTGVVQPFFESFHPNTKHIMAYVKFDVWPTSKEGIPMSVDVLEVFIDELEEI